MQYVVFDLEFNQDPDSLTNPDLTASSDPKINNISSKKRYPNEIIQIGAVKLDEELQQAGTFNRLVRPSLYARISPYITGLTGITSEMLQSEVVFSHVYYDFIEFIGDEETILCVWGMSDIKELYKTVNYYNLDENLLPEKYINIQPYASVHLGQSKKKLLRLSYCIEAMGIEIAAPFHDALYDALYTAEIFKKLYNPAITPKIYKPSRMPQQKGPAKPVLDFPKLIAQFEKMFSREMTTEEKEIIRLAYHMGKTGQFLITDDNSHD